METPISIYIYIYINTRYTRYSNDFSAVPVTTEPHAGQHATHAARQFDTQVGLAKRGGLVAVFSWEKTWENAENYREHRGKLLWKYEKIWERLENPLWMGKWSTALMGV